MKLCQRTGIHPMRLKDMALGKSEPSARPLTGWRWKCLICGRIYTEITESGLRQIASGIPVAEALNWVKDKDASSQNNLE